MSAAPPILIIGGGIAGLATALAAAPAPVLLLDRGGREPRGGASWLAQGGIAAALGAGDNPEAHLRDTLVAGSRHNDVAMVERLVRGAPAAVAWLQRLGVAFDRDGGGDLQLGHEGGHGRARIVHAGGDATGAKVMEVLVAAVRSASHVEHRTDVDVDALVLCDGRVAGVGASLAGGGDAMFEGRAVVLATGGIGGLFAQTSNPGSADGGGLALALAARAATRDLEFVQFHPTAFSLPGSRSLPLVTEALRGAGARLVDAHGASLMDGVHPQGDLAPRDVVARTVWRACRGEGAWLDAHRIGRAWPAAFPTVFRACMKHGIDPRAQPIPVVPAAHFHMGGIATDAEGQSSLPGLFAVGEVACNGVHGANRLASNSLLEGLVFGHRLGRALRARPTARARGGQRVAYRGASLGDMQLQALRELLSEAMGPVRDGVALRAALCECQALAQHGWQGALARELVAAALRRTGSLGAHFRSDAVAARAS